MHASLLKLRGNSLLIVSAIIYIATVVLLAIAVDTLVYQAKKKGRNRVEIAVD